MIKGITGAAKAGHNWGAKRVGAWGNTQIKGKKGKMRNMTEPEILARGSRRMKYGYAGGAGAVLLNRRGGSSSGVEGVQPHSSGGMTI